MELGKFKRVDFDDDDAMPDWLREDAPAKVEKKPLLPTKPAKHNQSQVKSTEGFSQPQVKSMSSPRTLRSKDKKSREQPQPTVSIQIHMPHFRLPKVSVPRRKIRPWIIAATLALVGIIGGRALLDQATQQKAPVPKAPTVVQAELGYKPLQSVQVDGGKATATKPKYDEQKKIYFYADWYKGADLDVVQQAVPEALKSNTTAQKEQATSIGANETFTTTVGTVYYSENKNANTQRLMVINNKMLMFIQSTKVLSNEDWVSYIQGLE